MGWKSERHLWVDESKGICICNRCKKEYPLHEKISNSYKCPQCRYEVNKQARLEGRHKYRNGSEADAELRKFADVWGMAGLYM